MKRLAAAGAKVKSKPIRAIDAMRALSAQFGSMVAIEAYAEHRAIFEFPTPNAWINACCVEPWAAGSASATRPTFSAAVRS